MDFLSQFYREDHPDGVRISAQQGSAFAKQIADDFNPIHHPDSRRFCVPGDLLFAIAIAKYGLRADMTFRFLDLLNADMPVQYPGLLASDTGQIEIKNAAGKATLGIQYSGLADNDEARKESLVRNYVAFSGHNFPDILVPLMKAQNVMFNPKRPLVIYESMHIQFAHFDFADLEISLGPTSLSVNGKRGDAKLHFSMSAGGELVGQGFKTLILSGLREYDDEAIQYMREEYARSKHVYAG